MNLQQICLSMARECITDSPPRLHHQPPHLQGLPWPELEAEVAFHTSGGFAVLHLGGGFFDACHVLALLAPEEDGVPLVVLRRVQAGEALVATIGGLEVEGFELAAVVGGDDEVAVQQGAAIDEDGAGPVAVGGVAGAEHAVLDLHGHLVQRVLHPAVVGFGPAPDTPVGGLHGDLAGRHG